MFGDSDSFYYCPGDDLTNSVQRRNAALLRCHESGCHDDVAAWRRADDRFFWNQAMLRELIDSRVGMRRRRQVPGFFYAAKVRAYRGLLHGWHYRILIGAFLDEKAHDFPLDEKSRAAKLTYRRTIHFTKASPSNKIK